MNSRRVLFVLLIMGLWSLSALAASPEGGVIDNEKPQTILPASKAFGDPTDFMAAGMAGAQYLMDLQSPTDGGWDWTSYIFTHSGNNSSGNLYGVTAGTLYELYLLDPTTDLWNAMTAAADWMVVNGPDTAYDIDSGPDIVFLMNYASLPGVGTPATYQAAAKAIWDNRKLENGGSAIDFCNYLYAGWSGNTGLAAWDVAAYCRGAQMLGDLYGAPYITDAVDIADFFHNDSFLSPGTGWFEVTVTANDYDYYTLGVTGLIRLFHMTGLHADKLPILYGLLLDCQFADGGFNGSYGTASGGADYQVTAYAVMALDGTDPVIPANSTALYDAAVWLGTYQDASGGFLYGDGMHVPEEGSECTFALFLAAENASANITAGAVNDPVNCSNYNFIDFEIEINDATPLVMGFEVVVEITADVTLPTSIDFAVNPLLGVDFFRVTGTNPYSVNGSFYGGDGISSSDDLFRITFDGLSEGNVDVTVTDYKLRDPENVFIFGDVSGAGFLVDCTGPNAVTDLTAVPHHNRVELGWTHDELDTVKYRIYHGVWYDTAPGVSAYPEYDDVGAIAPSRVPVAGLPNPGQGWVQVDGGTVLVGADSFFDVFVQVEDDLQRGVFYYEVLAEDAAGNVSAFALENARATNYWLGDITPVTAGVDMADGFVTPLPDISFLGAAFGEDDGDEFYNAYCDVGPTDDMSPVGIPDTDDQINFEDLMIFSMNFGVVSDINKSHDNISSTAQLAWVQAGEGQYALRLLGGDGIKGVHVTSSRAISSVVAGELLDAQDEMTFLKNIGSAMDINVSVMGQGNGFDGAGDLMVVNSSNPIDVADLTIEVRGHDNSVIQVSLDGTSGTVTPRVFALNAAFPNPFNPMTKISYSLPEAQDVRLNVYGIDGKLVASLVNETRAAGLHEVIWNGQNDAGQVQASGLYFYRIEAGPYSQVQKMTLMK